ncbi:MAG: hypothetical protein QOJ65_2580 [Fimbriimonadaceae bacterium]|nr:hypothetical protein [Fimbriimonadaceae bacterium]
MEAHTRSLAHTAERVVAGKSTGQLELGDEVTFEARHFWVSQRLTSRIVEFNPPHSFTDQMVRGAFKSLRHSHAFEAAGSQTRMTDSIEMAAPLGPLGWLAERLFLGAYMRRLIERRAQELKKEAESLAAVSDATT